MSVLLKPYDDLCEHVLLNGVPTTDRTGVGTLSMPAGSFTIDLNLGFPATTRKSLAWKSVVTELQWFMSGSTNVNDLRERLHGSRESGKTIWDDNYNNQGIALGYSDGNLGPVYGKQWRDFGGVDQLQYLIDGVKEVVRTGISNRRLVMSAWNPPELSKMALPPCHLLYQLIVSDNKLHAVWYQR